MSFVQPQKASAGRTAGIGVAIAFHMALIWALANGLGRQVLQIVNLPIETTLIEEIKPPPPPPKVIEMPPPPKVTPPPAFVPPPEVNVQPSPSQPTITATVAEPPPTMPEPMRIVPVPLMPPAPAPAPARVSASVACSNYAQVMGDAGFPREAVRAGLDEGKALMQFTLGPNGEIRDIAAVSASHDAFVKGAARIVAEYKCKGQGRDVVVQVPFVFKSS